MRKNSKHINCDNCGTLTEKKLTTTKIPRLGKIYEITVNAEICPNCGEIYIPGKFAQEFEKSLKNKELAAV